MKSHEKSLRCESIKRLRHKRIAVTSRGGSRGPLEPLDSLDPLEDAPSPPEERSAED